ncbi:MAG: hypothetical protein MK211_10330 [Flavobacteriales bacterium]|nr:hypothetical protein [Flavobacteriales bacterium]
MRLLLLILFFLGFGSHAVAQNSEEKALVLEKRAMPKVAASVTLTPAPAKDTANSSKTSNSSLYLPSKSGLKITTKYMRRTPHLKKSIQTPSFTSLVMPKTLTPVNIKATVSRKRNE